MESIDENCDANVRSLLPPFRKDFLMSSTKVSRLLWEECQTKQQQLKRRNRKEVYRRSLGGEKKKEWRKKKRNEKERKKKIQIVRTFCRQKPVAPKIETLE
jgi:hypothetical protein